jgi:sorbitol-specific phosphotransferase system component IIBC
MGSVPTLIYLMVKGMKDRSIEQVLISVDACGGGGHIGMCPPKAAITTHTEVQPELRGGPLPRAAHPGGRSMFGCASVAWGLLR